MARGWSGCKRKRTRAAESAYPSTRGHYVLPQLRYASPRRCSILPQMRAVGFLISEALRGEEAVLVNRAGEPFMRRYAPELKDLAPRDVVTRAIVEEMR